MKLNTLSFGHYVPLSRWNHRPSHERWALGLSSLFQTPREYGRLGNHDRFGLVQPPLVPIFQERKSINFINLLHSLGLQDAPGVSLIYSRWKSQDPARVDHQIFKLSRKTLQLAQAGVFQTPVKGDLSPSSVPSWQSSSTVSGRLVLPLSYQQRIVPDLYDGIEHLKRPDYADPPGP